ncbi:alpha/beta fold hydrolase [Gordonia insulae]|uniref:4,5:9,10-diseco-3-hydroxy-5,9, 17-trioxoandrosta-1(10),2-diene-4-oate hydrolase n=1 Tax=Gordonia insulae TaxID=2420509 RepID=A0A3G8JFL7_9ACTN|nr:alpha/beta hydrolase [Gordonia insulae]AZG43876.1 4,5:9,10-diseco-3-hydroxy-5,9,17-trioxoandrosta-1(10),2-diene-4-oate hydrolase [Gordonia insulae]
MNDNTTLTRSAQWEGRTVVWDRFGSGEPVVFLHGTPWSSALWRETADACARGFSVHLWDMPGYGGSSKEPEHPVDLGVQARLFAHLLDLWELDRPHVVAHDIGGAVALRTALLHGAHYRSLCLVDVVALRPWGSPFFTLVHDNPDVFAALPAAIHRGVLEAYIRGAAYRQLRPDDLDMLMSPWLDDAGQAAFYRQIAEADQMFTDAIEPAYPTLGIPTHIVWGREDTWIPVDRAHRLHDLIPGATVSEIAGAGHLIHFDAPAALTAEILRWLISRATNSRQTHEP